MPDWVIDILPAVGAAGAAWAAIKTELKWLRRDVDHLYRRVDHIEKRGIQ